MHLVGQRITSIILFLLLFDHLNPVKTKADSSREVSSEAGKI